MAHFGKRYEKDYHRKRALKFGVLIHLRLYSPKPLDTLCIQLRIDRDAEPILGDLQHKNYIEIGMNKMVAITASGRRYLEEHFDQKGDAQ